MARPRGGDIKTARVTINLDDRAYAVLLTIATGEDVPVSQVARRAVMDYLARQEPSLKQPDLPLIRSVTAHAEGKGRSASSRISTCPSVAALALREKRIQQNYRPIIAVHKWFARRPGTLFRALTLAEFGDGPVEDLFFRANSFPGKQVADPFMGGGTPLIEANRVGCDVLGSVAEHSMPATARTVAM